MKTITATCSLILLLGIASTLSAPLTAAESNERRILGLKGAVPITFSLDQASTVSVGIYTPDGQLVRPLIQAVELDAGTHRMDWDGMDMWGRLLSPGSPMTVKIYHHGGLQAFYEFNLGADDWDPASRPWAGLPLGEGDNLRTGAWLSDHKGPSAIAVAGDRIVVGTSGAEAGDSMMVLNKDGVKMYGAGGLGGFGGNFPAPNDMWSLDDETILMRSGNTFRQFNANTFQLKHVHKSKGKVYASTVHDNRLHILSQHGGKKLPIIGMNKAGPNPKKAEPQVIGDQTVQFQISPERRFSSTFRNSNHFQTGITAKVQKGYGFIVAPYAKSISISTMMIPNIERAEKIEIFTLKDGLNYDSITHHPFLGEETPDDFGLDLGPELSGLYSSQYWVPFGSSNNDAFLNVINGDKKSVQTKAILLRITPEPGKGKKRVKSFKLTHILPFTKRFDFVGNGKVIIDKSLIQRHYKRLKQGWDFLSSRVPSRDEPIETLIDYGKLITGDALATWGARSPAYTLSVLVKNIDPQLAEEDDWQEIDVRVAGPSKLTGDGNNRKRPRLRFIEFPETMSIRAVRMAYFDGVRRGKDGPKWLKAEPQRINNDRIEIVKLQDETRKVDPRGKAAWYTVVDLATGEQLRHEVTYGGDVKGLAVGDHDTFWTLTAQGLSQSTLQGENWQHVPFHLENRDRKISKIKRIGDELAVMLRGPLVLLDAQSGAVNNVLGGWDGYQIGDWDRNTLNRPADVSIDQQGKYWLVESSWYPKRVARFNADGICEWNVNGQPEYGGGGFIHPDFNSFTYRGMRFDINEQAGTSHMIGLYDHPYTEVTPDPTRAFHFSRGGRVIQHKGYDYLVHDGSYISILEGNSIRPVVVWGSANKSNFLTAPEKKWHKHWLKQNLSGKFFVWTDLNADGAYQIEEVALHRQSLYSSAYFTNTFIGNDLTLWSNAGRWQPSEINQHGVPIFEIDDFQKWNGRDRLPIYLGMSEHGSRAAPAPNAFGGASLIDGKGRMSYLHSPYLFNPDLSVFGGEPDTSGGGDGYRPEVIGQKIHHATGFAGFGTADGAVDEVQAVTGNLGRLTFIAGQDRLVLGQVFTGKNGDIASLEAKRGIEATGHVLYYENFFGHFLRVNDGRHFFQSGQNSHALFRIEGLNNIQLIEQKVVISDDQFQANQVIRKQLVQDWKTRKAAQAKERELLVYEDRERIGTSGVSVDGSIGEWGNFESMSAIDEVYSVNDAEPRMFVDATRNKEGLILAFAGFNHTKGVASSPKEIFSAGFAFDFRFRIPPEKDKSKSKLARMIDNTPIIKGDRRIVFGQINGEWKAVLFDYVNEDVPFEEQVTFASPHVETRIASMRVLSDEEITLRVESDALVPNMNNLEGAQTDGGIGLLSANLPQTTGKSERDQYTFWTAEVLIPYKLLGGKRSIQADVGIIGGKSDGSDAGERWHWASPRIPQTVSDIGAEAAIDPSTWGRFIFSRKE